MFVSRRRLTLITITLLLALDLGRSLYTRVGANTPTRLWSADQSYAAPIAWPPGSDLQPDAPLGQRVFAQHCAVCHGPQGKGNGPAAPSLRPRPRDFSGGVFKLKATPDSHAPTLDDVRRTIKRGMPGSSMPAWGDLLSAAEVDAVADYIRGLGPHTAWSPPPAPVVAPDVLTRATAEQGRRLFVDLGCPACHGTEGRGDGASAKELRDVWKQPDPPRDLTAPWTFRGGNAPEALYTRIARGMSGTPMPGYADVAEPAEIAAVVAYVHSIQRTPPWEPGGVLDGPGQSATRIRRGEYLVHAGMCGLCHTPVDAHGIYLADTHYLAGGMKVDAGAHGIYFTRNLTSDPETGLGAWSEDQIAMAIRSGHTPHGRLNYWGMPWMVLGSLTAEDTQAIALYLKTLPAVYNRVPDPLHYGFVETVIRKLRYPWPALVPARLAYYAGNYGSEQRGGFTRDLPQRVLVLLQYAVLGVALVLLLTTHNPRPRRREPSLGLAFLKLILFVVVSAAALLVYRYPAVDMMPARQVIEAFSAAIPTVRTDNLPAHEGALLQRGRYLYGIASCPYCHNDNGAGGGKVNWEVFGTTWARNLTSHSTGLADWSDDAVLRAMISGIGRDGRPLHWQAMIWDHLSNYSVEDQHALLAYMRALPAVPNALPAPLPPGSEDCPGDTFWIGTTNFEPGCR